MNVKTPVRRHGHVVVDAEGVVVCRGSDIDPLKDIVLMLNYQELLVRALLLWDQIFSEPGAKEGLSELVGQEEANAVLSCTMQALHPRLWKLALEHELGRRNGSAVAQAARDAFPHLVSLLSPDLYPSVFAAVGEDGYEKLDHLVAASLSVLDWKQ